MAMSDAWISANMSTMETLDLQMEYDERIAQIDDLLKGSSEDEGEAAVVLQNLRHCVEFAKLCQYIAFELSGRYMSSESTIFEDACARVRTAEDAYDAYRHDHVKVSL